MLILYCTPSYTPRPYFYFNVKDWEPTWIIMPEYLNYLEDVEYKCIRKIARQLYRTGAETNYGVSVSQE
jgi:hypothetical protein